jgi:folate-binding protein YgfZ
MTQVNCEKRHFGDPQSEYEAAKNSAAVFDLSNRVHLELVGPDRNAFLHNFCTNDINAMPAGTACEAFLLNAKGRMLGYVQIYVGENNTWVESVPGQGEFLQSHLTKYHLLEDFELKNRSDARCEMFVTGPNAQAQVNSLLSDGGIDGLADRTWRTCKIHPEDREEFPIDVRRWDLFGQPAYSISLDEFSLDSDWSTARYVWDVLQQNGVQPAGCDVFESLRIEHAIPIYGTDLGDNNLAQEANRTERAISFEKGCYLGQEPVARLNSLGHVNREITRFTIESTPTIGAAFLNPDKPDKEVGKLTSVAWSWDRNCAIGLGLLRTQFGKPGTELSLTDGSRATVL